MYVKQIRSTTGRVIVSGDVKQQRDGVSEEDNNEEPAEKRSEHSSHSMTVWLNTWVRQGVNSDVTVDRQLCFATRSVNS
jgi:hypothetical protein